MNLGQTIKQQRRKIGQSQGAFAEKCFISQTYLSQIEGNKKEPTIPVLRTMAENLGISLPVLFFLSIDSADEKPEDEVLERIKKILLAA